MDQHHHAKPGSGADYDPPDKELIDRVRGGDLEAFDPLYRRHRDSGMRHARHWTRSEAAAEDLCAESFTRVLHAIRNGNGPTEAFRPYLLTAMRNVARDWAEGDRRTMLVPDFVDVAPIEPEQDPVITALERSLAGMAFMSLSERWQTVLWQTEVEREGPSQLAAQLGIDAAAVSALAYRAREGLKQAYLQAHISEIGSPTCRPYAERLGAHTRKKLRGREAAKVRQHLKHCTECVGLYAMLKYINANIHTVIAPAVIGTAAATKAVVVLYGLSAGAGAAAGSGAHQGLVVRIASKARHASPRQQAVAATTTAAVAAAVIALALTGNHSPAPPAAAAKPKPPATQPAPPPPPPPAQKPPPPAASPPPPAPSSPPSPTPSPTPPKPTPPKAPPSPTPTLKRVPCPGVVFGDQGLTGGQAVMQLADAPAAVSAPGSQDWTWQWVPGQERPGAGVIVPANCPTTGPPHPFNLPSTPAPPTPSSAVVPASPAAVGPRWMSV